MHAIFIVIQPALYHRISLFLSLRIVLLFSVLKWLRSALCKESAQCGWSAQQVCCIMDFRSLLRLFCCFSWEGDCLFLFLQWHSSTQRKNETQESFNFKNTVLLLLVFVGGYVCCGSVFVVLAEPEVHVYVHYTTDYTTDVWIVKLSRAVV